MTDASERIIGIVKWYDPLKGIGFIKPTQGECGVSIYDAQIKSAGYATLYTNDTVSYKTIDLGKGLQAYDIRKAG